MIADSFSYVAILVALGGGLTYLESRSKSRFFEYAPPIVLLYFGVMQSTLTETGSACESTTSDYRFCRAWPQTST